MDDRLRVTRLSEERNSEQLSVKRRSGRVYRPSINTRSIREGTNTLMVLGEKTQVVFLLGETLDASLC